jgi:hypothetical protein
LGHNQDETSTHYTRYVLVRIDEKKRKRNVSVRYIDVQCLFITFYSWPCGGVDR